jgi:glutathione S-transferase
MSAYPLTTIATLLALFVYAAFGAVVSRARVTYAVPAPAVTGNPDFERRHRVHMNTLEQLPIFLTLLWLCAAWIGDPWAALAGLVWCIGRAIYARGYYREAARREIGFVIGTVPVLAMLLAVIVALIVHWL